MRISAYLIIDDITLSDGQANAARAAGGEWTTLPARNGRAIVSCLAPDDMIDPLMAMLAPYSPILVGVWDAAPEPVYDADGNVIPPGPSLPREPIAPATLAAFVEAMPDEWVGYPGIATRPTAPRDLCRFAGWPERVL